MLRLSVRARGAGTGAREATLTALVRLGLRAYPGGRRRGLVADIGRCSLEKTNEVVCRHLDEYSSMSTVDTDPIKRE